VLKIQKLGFVDIGGILDNHCFNFLHNII